MPSSERQKRGYSRRFLWLAVAIVAIGLVYTGGWFYFARQLEAATDARLSALNGDGIRADCENPTARGYPFRIGLFCDGLLYDDTEGGVSVRTGAFRSAAQIYQPSNLVGEIDGPAEIALPGLPALDVEWGALRASARLAEPLPEIVSMEGRDVVVTPGDAPETPVVEAERAEFHARPSGADLDVAMRFSGLAVDPALMEAASLPPLDGRADVKVVDGVGLLAQGLRDIRGNAATIRDLTLTGGDAGVSVSGPVSVAENGLIDAELSVSIREPAALARILREAFPAERERLEPVFASLEGLGASPSLSLKIVEGRVRVGFVPVGRIPPL